MSAPVTKRALRKSARRRVEPDSQLHPNNGLLTTDVKRVVPLKPRPRPLPPLLACLVQEASQQYRASEKVRGIRHALELFGLPETVLPDDIRGFVTTIEEYMDTGRE